MKSEVWWMVVWVWLARKIYEKVIQIIVSKTEYYKPEN